MPPQISPTLIERADAWRGAPLDAGETPYREWQHFIVFTARGTLLLNLCLEGTQRGEVIALLSGAPWVSEVRRCAAPQFVPSRLDASFEGAGMRWRDGCYEIWLDGATLRLEMRLTPAAIPSLTHHIRLGPGAYLSWCLVPRLFADGWIEGPQGRHIVVRAVAYHDHNWGRFRWGGDFSWDWACAVPDDPDTPWTLIVSRMNDRARHRTTATSVFLLKDGRHLRYFRNHEVAFSTTGAMAPRPDLRAPAAAALMLPDRSPDVALSTRIAARRGDDILHAELTGRTRAQLLVPSDVDICSVVRLNEVDARAVVKGRCAGEFVNFEGSAVLEVVYA